MLKLTSADAYQRRYESVMCTDKNAGSSLDFIVNFDSDPQ